MRKPTPHGAGRRHRAYVAFAGGGAKGILHVGALKAIEVQDLQIKGLAGTSIGAVVAALKAAGYSADDLVDPECETTLMEVIREIDPKIAKVTDLFGPLRWPCVWTLRELVRRPGIVLTGGLAFLLYPVLGFSLLLHMPEYSFLIIGLWVASVMMLTAVIGYALYGLASLSRFRRVFHQLLQRKLFPDDPSQKVLMRHFDGTHAPALKIVASNLTQSRLQLFSKDTTPEVSVANAVIASISLPVVFRLPRVARRQAHESVRDLFADGGVVSNLPAWPFDEERELDPGALTVAIDIPDREQRGPPGRFTWLLALLRTGFFGGGELNLRASNSMLELPLETKIRLLDFDMKPAAVFETVKQARSASELILAKTLRDPRYFVEVCEHLRKVAVEAAEKSPLVLPNGPGRLRVAIAEPEEGYYHSLRLCHCVGYCDDTDQMILLPRVGTVVGKAYQTKEAQLERSPFTGYDLAGEENMHVKRLIRRELKWIFCVPIFGPDGSMRFVLSFDGDTEITDTDETVDFMKELGKLSQQLLGGLMLPDKDHAQNLKH